MKVTYLNVLDNKRHVLIDNIDMNTALSVLAKFGDKAQPYLYMPGLAIEPDDSPVPEVH